MSLDQKTCVPCTEGVPALLQDQVDKLLKELNSLPKLASDNWIVNNQGHLYASFIFKNFVQAMEFANKITKLAEEEGHHPDLHISWGKCDVEIWTHKINGLSESDFVLAAKVNNVK